MQLPLLSIGEHYLHRPSQHLHMCVCVVVTDHAAVDMEMAHVMNATGGAWMVHASSLPDGVSFVVIGNVVMRVPLTADVLGVDVDVDRDNYKHLPLRRHRLTQHRSTCVAALVLGVV